MERFHDAIFAEVEVVAGGAFFWLALLVIATVSALMIATVNGLMNPNGLINAAASRSNDQTIYINM